MKKCLLAVVLLPSILFAKDAYIVGDATKAGALFPSWTITQITKEEVSIPTPRAMPSPNIPFELRREGVSGSLKVALLIDTSGNVAESAIWSSENEKLNKPVLAAVKSWKFKPATFKGKKAAYVAVAPLEFNFKVAAPVTAEELKRVLEEKQKTK